MESSYIISAAKAQQLPAYNQREIGFLGRSNCGKSTLLNAILERKSLARTSNTPGRTQMVNFFSWNNGEIEAVIADLPGFGYSATGKDTRQHWESLMQAYIERDNIVTFLLLSDGRRKLNEDDIEIAKFIAKKRPLIMILTKIDKMKQSELQKSKNSMKETLAKHKIKYEAIYAVSCLKKTGIEDLRELIKEKLFS